MDKRTFDVWIIVREKKISQFNKMAMVSKIYMIYIYIYIYIYIDWICFTK